MDGREGSQTESNTNSLPVPERNQQGAIHTIRELDMLDVISPIFPGLEQEIQFVTLNERISCKFSLGLSE